MLLPDQRPLTPRYRENPELPGLAWLARLDWTDRLLEVIHGRWVECRPSFFLEGAWGGPFEEGRLDSTEVVFGSGGVILPGEVRFVPSLATTDYLYYRPGPTGITIANSLPLLLAVLGDRLNPGSREYHDINQSITRGVNEYREIIPTQNGDVRRLMHRNLVSTANAIALTGKPDAPEFPGFEAYHDYLSSSYRALARNARDPARSYPLRIYSTQSRGYDTTAINAVAAPEGIDGVFTITRGKGRLGGPEENDDGTDVARALGLGGVIPLDRELFRRDPTQEIYLHASISENQDANLHGVAQHLSAPALLLTGTLGEIWYTSRCWLPEHPHTVHSGLARGDLGTHGLTEVRLRTGYIQVAIPYLGARRREQILSITESEGMAPWRLDNDYDRPIPRRLAETAGVSRAAFGQVKMASVVEWAIPNLPVDPTLRRRYLDFLRDDARVPRWQVPWLSAMRRFNQGMGRFWWRSYGVLRYPLGILYRGFGIDLVPPVLGRSLRGSLFCFAVNETATEYAGLLATPHAGH